MTLTLRSLPHPAAPARPVRFFGTPDAALDHLRHHLLTSPEAEAWALVAPGYEAILDPRSSDARYRYWQKAVESGGDSAQPLYDLYLEAVRGDAADADRLGWLCSAPIGTVAFGTSGVLLIVGAAVVTAFLPGQGDPAATRKGQEAGPNATGLVREGGMRSGRPGRFRADEAERERRERLEREANWSRAERIYYRVFRSAVQFIRGCHIGQHDPLGRPLRGDYGRLKDVLPSRSRLCYADWAEFRTRCRGEEDNT
jgi:hypothetical protein